MGATRGVAQGMMIVVLLGGRSDFFVGLLFVCAPPFLFPYACLAVSFRHFSKAAVCLTWPKSTAMCSGV